MYKKKKKKKKKQSKIQQRVVRVKISPTEKISSTRVITKYDKSAVMKIS